MASSQTSEGGSPRGTKSENTILPSQALAAAVTQDHQPATTEEEDRRQRQDGEYNQVLKALTNLSSSSSSSSKEEEGKEGGQPSGASSGVRQGDEEVEKGGKLGDPEGEPAGQESHGVQWDPQGEGPFDLERDIFESPSGEPRSNPLASRPARNAFDVEFEQMGLLPGSEEEGEDGSQIAPAAVEETILDEDSAGPIITDEGPPPLSKLLDSFEPPASPGQDITNDGPPPLSKLLEGIEPTSSPNQGHPASEDPPHEEPPHRKTPHNQPPPVPAPSAEPGPMPAPPSMSDVVASESGRRKKHDRAFQVTGRGLTPQDAEDRRELFWALYSTVKVALRSHRGQTYRIRLDQIYNATIEQMEAQFGEDHVYPVGKGGWLDFMEDWDTAWDPEKVGDRLVKTARLDNWTLLQRYQDKERRFPFLVNGDANRRHQFTQQVAAAELRLRDWVEVALDDAGSLVIISMMP